MYSNRVQFKRSHEISIEVAAIAAYVRTKGAPFVGLPVVENGSRRPAVFMRKHLLAAIESRVASAIFNTESNTLTLNSGPSKAKYVLKDLVATGHRQAWQVQDELAKWAASKRRAVVTKALPAHLRKDAKRRAEIAKLEKELGKLYLRAPQNPALSNGREHREWTNRELATWATQRAQRKALGRLYGKYLSHLYKPTGRFPWAAVLADVEAAGMRIDSYNAWGRVRTRVAHKGLSLPEYLKSLWKFVGLVRKPWDAKPHEFAESCESYRRDRQSFLESTREAASIRAHIANLKAATEPLVLELAKVS